jgi:hypothetical protein
MQIIYAKEMRFLVAYLTLTTSNAFTRSSHSTHVSRIGRDFGVSRGSGAFSSQLSNDETEKTNRLSSSEKRKKKFELPPFKIGDGPALLSEISAISASQLLVSIYTIGSSPDFPGWLSPVDINVLSTSPTFSLTLFNIVSLCVFWVTSLWSCGCLANPSFLYRFKDAVDVSWTQWIAVANQFVLIKLLISVANGTPVTGIETPLLTGLAAVVAARVLYYNLPL